MHYYLGCAAVLWLGMSPVTADLRIATFECDVTPPIGHPLCGGWIQPLSAVDDPLLAKGVVLDDDGSPYVLCAVDWCLLQTGAYEVFRQKLAQGAGTTPDRVAVHTVHQHNAPLADSTAERLLQSTDRPPRHLDLEFLEAATDRLAAAVNAAGRRLTPVTHVGHGQSRVERFASNRRVRLADGKIHVRYSATKDEALRAAPEGLIDPWLRTVSLFRGDQPLVRLHYYASHPMSYYGDGRATSDTVGLARERLEDEEGVPQIYFTGCGGNITAGKYNDGSPEARRELTTRIHTAMRAAIADTRRTPVTRMVWKTDQVRFTARTEADWSESRARTSMTDTNATVLERLKGALDLAWIERLQRDDAVAVSRLSFGEVNILHLPGEAFVEYQLFAQSLRPSDFVAVAAYGESGPGYICTDAALSGGGYEPTMSRVGPPTEFEMKGAITRLLSPVPRVGPRFYPDKLSLLWWRDEQGVERPVRNRSDWAHRRADIVAGFEAVAGPQPPVDGEVPLDLRVHEEFDQPGYVVRGISYASEPGDRVPALLLVPRGLAGPRPAMLCLHQTTKAGKREPAGLEGNRELAYAAELASRGYVTLAPDYPNFGDYAVDAYARGYASATRKGLWNHRRAIDVLASLDEVDPERMGAIGHSLGGHNALFVAVMDPRVRAVVTSCGFNAFPKYYGGDLKGWSHAGYMPRIASAYECDPRLVPFDFTELLAALAPRPVFINAPLHDDNFEVSGVHDCLEAARPVYTLFDAESALVARHPDCAHDFPREIREESYAWLDRVLGNAR